jgi:hypothetical protein
MSAAWVVTEALVLAGAAEPEVTLATAATVRRLSLVTALLEVVAVVVVVGHWGNPELFMDQPLEAEELVF